MSVPIANMVAELPDLPSLISTILRGQLAIEERIERSILKPCEFMPGVQKSAVSNSQRQLGFGEFSFMYVKCVLRWRWGFAKSRPGCASRRREGGRAASEVDHHARPLAARWRGRNERGERGRNEPMGHFRRDFSKGLLEGTFRTGTSAPHGLGGVACGA